MKYYNLESLENLIQRYADKGEAVAVWTEYNENREEIGEKYEII